MGNPFAGKSSFIFILCLSIGLSAWYFWFINNKLPETNIIISAKANTPMTPSLKINHKTNATNKSLPAHLSVQYSWFFIENDKIKLMYCKIPKTSCTKFTQLFYAILHQQNPKMLKNELRYDVMSIHSALQQTHKRRNIVSFITDEKYKSFVIVRDPLERLLSGFLSKCIAYAYAGVKVWEPPHGWCLGNKTNNFTEFAHRFVTKLQNGDAIDGHYLPQYMSCDLDKLFPDFIDYTIYFNKRTIGNDTLQFLRELNHESYYYGWGENKNETLFQSFTSHATSVNNLNDCKFYGQYFTKQIVNEILSVVDKDYKLFNMRKPNWIECV